MPVGWVLLRNKPAKEDQPLTIAEEYEMKSDREEVLAAVKESGNALEYTDDSLKADREIVLAAIESNRDVIRLADQGLKAQLIKEGLF